MTKLHKTATALLLTAALLLSSCAEQSSAPGSDIGTSSKISDGNSFDSAETYDNSTSTTSESSAFSESESDTNSYDPLDNIIAPDGSTIPRSEAVRESGSGLEFDFTYIRYAKPVFRTTFDEPDLIDWEKDIDDFLWNPDNFYIIEDTNYFKVKSGDRLDNGLVVKSAKYGVDAGGCGRNNEISFDGELTLTGVLECLSLPEDPSRTNGYVSFYADTSQFDTFPIIFPGADLDDMDCFANVRAKFAMVYDNTDIDIGFINDIDIDLSGIIAPGEYKKVKVTINNIYSRYVEGPNRSMTADLVSVEPIT